MSLVFTILQKNGFAKDIIFVFCDLGKCPADFCLFCSLPTSVPHLANLIQNNNNFEDLIYNKSKSPSR